MAIFSAGYLAVSCVFLLLFRRALRMKEELELNQLEVFETKVSIGASMVNGGVALTSLLIALSGRGDLAGVIYPILIGPAFTVYYTVRGKQKRRLMGV